jgi:hypothetical protein
VQNNSFSAIRTSPLVGIFPDFAVKHVISHICPFRNPFYKKAVIAKDWRPP